jgi:hypothetical protein
MMNTDMFRQSVIPAALFIAMEGLCAVHAIAGDGVVILQREVPVRQATRQGELGRATSVDVSPNDKVQRLTNSSQSGLNSIELGDADFAAITTGTSQMAGVITNQTNLANLTDTHNIGHNLSGGGGAQTIGSMVTGSVGGAVGATVGHVGSLASGVSGALSNMTSAILSGSGK